MEIIGKQHPLKIVFSTSLLATDSVAVAAHKPTTPKKRCMQIIAPKT
jgi:hypothetical protein